LNKFTYMTDRNFSNGRDYIGASDMATLAGVNPYQTPLEFWEEKTGRKEGFKGNTRTDAGHEEEPSILGHWIKEDYINKNIKSDTHETTKEIITKEAKRKAGDFIVSRLWDQNVHENYHSFSEFRPTHNNRFVAHPDLLDLSNPDEPILIQAKNTGRFAADQRKKNPFKGYSKDDLSQNGVNIAVYLQEQWELYCSGIKKAYVSVKIEGWDKKIYGPIHYNKKDVEKLVVLAEKMLWHIDNDIPPEPIGWPDIQSLYPEIEKNTKTVLSPEEEIEAKTMIKQHSKYKEDIRDLKSKCLDIEMALAMLAGEPKLKIMRNYLTTSTGEKIATFGERAGCKFISLKKLEEYPELLAKCEEIGAITESGSSRNIRIN